MPIDRLWNADDKELGLLLSSDTLFHATTIARKHTVPLCYIIVTP